MRSTFGSKVAMRRFRQSLRVLIAVALAVAASALPGPAMADPPMKPKKQYYLSVGDSYATGYQPGGMTRMGFPNQVVSKAAGKGHRLTLVNVACAGATTVSLLTSSGCPPRRLAIGAHGYGHLTQARAAVRFLKRHRGRVALVTVSIGGNDITRCAAEQDAIGCATRATADVRANVGRLARQLRRAAGPKTLIVGTTYPDVLLGQWVRDPVNEGLARLSVVAFKSLVNPALATAYSSVDGRFADVTAATGAYGSLDGLTTLAPYGRIPVPVAKVCRLTWYCSDGDIHARDLGYGIIADLVVGELLSRR